MSKFIDIDRDQEDDSVMEFQKTKNTKILEQLYKNRIQTIENLSRKNMYLSENDEIYGLLTEIFMECVKKYQKFRIKIVDGKEILKHTSFNTYFYTAAKYRLANEANRAKTKKRSIEHNGKMQKPSIYSLDFDYYDKDGKPTRLKQIIENTLKSEEEKITNNMKLDEIIGVLSAGNDNLKDFFKKISEGKSISNIIKDKRIRLGKIKIKKEFFSKLIKNSKKQETVCQIIRKYEKIQNFRLLDYKLENDAITYKIYTLNDNNINEILNKMKELKENPKEYLSIIKNKKNELEAID